MIKKIFILYLALFASAMSAQKKEISKISKKINDAEFSEAEILLNEYKTEFKEDAAYLFYYVKNKVSQPIEKLELRNCVFQLEVCKKTYLSLDAKDREYFCEKLSFCENSASNLLQIVTKQYWTLIQKNRDLAEIEQFISEIQSQEYQSEAILLRDEIAYRLISNSSKIEDFKNYLLTYPLSSYKNKVVQRIEELAYAEALVKNNIGDFKIFIQLYPNSTLVPKATENILDLEWSLAKSSNDLDVLKKFNLEHTNCIYSSECKKLIATSEWRILSSSQDAKVIDEWALKNEQYPEAALARARARDLKDFVLPYITKNRTFKFFYVIDKKIDESNEYQQISRLDNGNFLVLQNNLIGMIDRKGKVILPPQFLSFDKIQSNFLAFGNNKYQVIGADGTLIKDLNYKLISRFYENDFKYSIVWNIVNGTKKCGVINSQGDEVIPVKFDYIEPVKSGFLLYTKGNPKNLCDLVREDGSLILSKIETAYCNIDGYFVFERNDKYGVVDTNGKILTPPIYSGISVEQPNQFIVYTDNDQKSIIDSTGNELLRSGNYNSLQHLAHGIYGVGDWGNFNLFDARSGRYFGSSGYESANSWACPEYIIMRKGLEIEVIESATRKSIKKITLNDNTSDEYEGEGDGYDGEGDIAISEYSSIEFDETFKPEFSTPKTAYLGGNYETPHNPSNLKRDIIYEIGNPILFNKETGELTVYSNYDSVLLLSNDVIALKEHANGFLKLVDSNNRVIKESINWAYAISDNEIVYTSNVGNSAISYLLNTTTNKTKELGMNISNYSQIDDYCRYSYKDIQIYELKDGTKLFDNTIDFNKYEAEQLNSKASNNYYNKNYQEAIRIYKESLNLNPENFSVYINISNCYLNSNQYSDALAWINKAINENPEFNESYYNARINVYEKQNNKFNMAGDYHTLAEKSKYSSLYYYQQAIYNYNLAKSYYDAIRVADEALSKNKSPQKNSTIAMIYNSRGNSNYSLGQYASALTDFTNALKHEEDFNKDNCAMICENIGLSYINLKNNAMACKYFKQACTLGRCSNTWRCR